MSGYLRASTSWPLSGGSVTGEPVVCFHPGKQGFHPAWVAENKAVVAFGIHVHFNRDFLASQLLEISDTIVHIDQFIIGRVGQVRGGRVGADLKVVGEQVNVRLRRIFPE